MALSRTVQLEGIMANERSRRHHTRSRDGCTTCRKRHVRCDETRPFCANCSHYGRHCEYPAVIPLRERRAKQLPGQQQPFTLVPGQNSTPVEDESREMGSSGFSVHFLDSWSVSMPLRSRELLNYFQKTTEHDLQSILSEKWKHTLSLTLNHPDVLRSTLLIAGLHYTWRVGELRGYEPTYLFHKFETMDRLKESLACPTSTTELTHLVGGISTLCLIECSLGNLVAAETHRDGLVSLMDITYPWSVQEKTSMSHDEQLAYRNLMLMCNVLHSIKSRILSSKTLLSLLKRGDGTDSAKLIPLLKKWNRQGFGSLDMIMKSMLLVPFFQAFSEEPASDSVDASSIIASLRMLTASSTALPSLSPEQQAIDPGVIWIDGAASKLAFALVSSQIDTSSKQHKKLKGAGKSADEQRTYYTSWCGMATATELYLDCVLGIWNAGEPIERRVLRRMMLVLAQDLRETLHEVADPAAQDLWLWKALVGACSLAKYAHRGDDDYDDGTLGAFEVTFQGLVLLWSEENSVTAWTEIQSRVASIAWPVMQSRSPHAGEDVWHKAVQLRQQVVNAERIIST